VESRDPLVYLSITETVHGQVQQPRMGKSMVTRGTGAFGDKVLDLHQERHQGQQGE
jgi:archaellum component FlaC